MKELDTTLAGLANQRTTINRNSNGNVIDLEQARRTREQVMRNSIHRENMTREIPGEVYVGRTNTMLNFIKVSVPVALATVALVLTTKVGIAYTTVDEYDNKLNQAMSESLTLKQKEIYQEEHDSVFERVDAFFENYDRIKENEETLKATGDYNFLGEKAGEEKIIKDPGSIIQLTNLTEDAIDMAVQEEIQEYQSRR